MSADGPRHSNLLDNFRIFTLTIDDVRRVPRNILRCFGDSPGAFFMTDKLFEHRFYFNTVYHSVLHTVLKPIVTNTWGHERENVSAGMCPKCVLYFSGINSTIPFTAFLVFVYLFILTAAFAGLSQVLSWLHKSYISLFTYCRDRCSKRDIKGHLRPHVPPKQIEKPNADLLNSAFTAVHLAVC